jgi:hypothetical protein
VAIVYTDLIEPNGPLEPEFIEDEATVPDEDEPLKTKFQVRIESYITIGEDQATEDGVPLDKLDEPTRLWALFRAYAAIHKLKANRPLTERDIEGIASSRTYSKEQLQFFADERDRYRSLYGVTVTEINLASQAVAVPATYSGHQQKIRYDW